MTLKKRNIRALCKLMTALFAVLPTLLFVSCRIEPPLHLADNRQLEVKLPELITEIEVIWGDSHADEWWYGWDEDDINLFGPLDYPVPSTYEVRLYYFGENPDAGWLSMNTFTIDGNRFRRAFYYGFHDLLVWSNIDSPDHTQVLMVDESDPDNIKATTTETRLRFGSPSRSDFKVYNGPEIFYGGLKPKLYVSEDPNDYDYYDEERKVWVKHLSMEISPMVYTYLVQVVIYNNNGRILGINERTSVSSLARGVSLHTGRTSYEDAIVCFDMRLKKDLPVSNSRKADIMGGKLTTFGLCDMEPWISSRAESHYTGSRTDLLNSLLLNLRFHNETEGSFSYDITPQMRRQAHGGVITVEIDADTISIPNPPSGGNTSAGFDPTVENPDEEEHEFIM